MEIVRDIKTERLQTELANALYTKYRPLSADADWLAQDDAANIVRNLDVILPVLERFKA